MEKTILLVDDEQDVLDGLKRGLRKLPFQLVTATSGEEAVEILSNTTIHVIVSDEVMPGMSGSDLLEYARQHYPSAIRIMLTGNASVTSAMRAIYDGWVYQYLHKPCNPMDLASAIHNGLLLQSLQKDESPHVMLSHQEQSDLLAHVAEKSTEDSPS